MEIRNREKTERDECVLKRTDGCNDIEKQLNQSGWKTIVRGITLPQQRKESIMDWVKASQAEKHRKSKSKAAYRMRYARLVPAAICILLILATAGMTARAVYVNRHLSVFFEKDMTMEQLHDIEKELLQMEGVVSCRYIAVEYTHHPPHHT